jgi:hypothetical protein
MQTIIEQNARLKRICRQDRAILARQNEELGRLRRKFTIEFGGTDAEDESHVVGHLRWEFRRASEELEALTEQVNVRHAPAKTGFSVHY